MTGQQVGYTRVSSTGQRADRQLEGIHLDRVFEDVASGKSKDRPALRECLAYVRCGDTLHVHSMDRLARNVEDLARLVRELTGRGVAVRFSRENLSFTGNDSPMSMLLLQLLGAVAQFERSLILERQREGIAIAKAAGVYRGRKPALSKDQVRDLALRAAAGAKKTDLAKTFGISRESVYRYIEQAKAANSAAGE